MKAYIMHLVALAVTVLALSLSFSSLALTTQEKKAPETTLEGLSAQPLIKATPSTTKAPTGLSPAQIRAAYNMPATGGQGTIAIIDAFDDPTVLNDLTVFSTQFNLPLPNASNFEKHMMTPKIALNTGWAVEISLDVQWAHAIAPDAKILLVESTTNSYADLLAAVDYARSRADVVAVSMSWGGSEFSTESAYDCHFTSASGIAFFASSGDNGAGVSFPASSPNVIAVGGTTLNLTSSGSVITETGWTGSGGGTSSYEPEPAYQTTYDINFANGKRCVPDVSYDADPRSGVAVYDTSTKAGQAGWWSVGGTSVGAPQWAAIQALGHSCLNSNFYQIANSVDYNHHLRDITVGTNGKYSAKPGYDLVTGLGSPLTTNFTVTPTPTFSVSASPSNFTATLGTQTRVTISVMSIRGFNGTVVLTPSAPAGFKLTLINSSITIIKDSSNSTILIITTLTTAQPGLYTIAVTGTNGPIHHQATVTVTVQTPPSPPQNLKTTARNLKVILTWSAPLTNGGSPIIGYTVYRGTSPKNLTSLTSLANRLNYTDNAVKNGMTYYYQVTASNTIGESQKSNQVSAVPAIVTLAVTITTSKTSYPRLSSIPINIAVKDNNKNPVQGATVNVTVYNPNGTIAALSYGTITAPNGIYSIIFTLGKNSPTGTYKIVAIATCTGCQSGTGQATFTVKA
jgi:subtilase family serine protease